MTSRKALTLAAAFGLLLSAADVRSAPQAPGLSAPAATSVRLGSIVGSAWNADNTGIAGAHLRLRNLSNGKSVSATVADQVGQFRFDTVAEGSYLIELVDESAKVLAVGQMFSIAPGETVATFVRLGTHVPWFAGFFSNAATAAIAAAASEGVTALAPVARPVSRKQ